MKYIIKFAPIRIVFYIVFFGFFAILSTHSAESGSLCVLYNAIGIICPSCGITRAFTNFMHGNFISAYSYNEILTLFFAPAAILVALQDTFMIIKRYFSKKKTISMLEFYMTFLFGGI